MTKAIVVGGGIAGTVAAMALQKAGIDAVVNEEYGRSADGVGAYLTLAVNGLGALSCLGLDGVVGELGFASPTMAMYLGSGRKLAEYPFADEPYRTVKRADLYAALRDEAVRRGIEIRYGKRLEDATRSGSGVVAQFRDGTSDTADLLIGADGLRSRTRELIDPAAPRARYVPVLNTGGFAHGVTVDATPGCMNMIFGRRAFFAYYLAPGGEVWWFANPPRRTEPTAAELAAIGSEQWREKLIELFRVDRSPAVDIIRATDRIVPAWPTYDFPTVPNWHRGRMLIIGDAAHAVSPASGQGASMAMEDAVVLAKCLRDVPDIPAALRAYEGRRRARVERIVAQGKKNGDGKAAGPVGRIIRDLILKRVTAKPQAPGGDPQRWMWDFPMTWDAPIEVG